MRSYAISGKGPFINGRQALAEISTRNSSGYAQPALRNSRSRRATMVSLDLRLVALQERAIAGAVESGEYSRRKIQSASM